MHSSYSSRQGGFSIIQVLLVIGIISVNGYFAFSTVEQMQDIETTIMANSTASDIMAQTQRVLMNSQACISTINPGARSNIALTNASFDSDGAIHLTSIFDEYYFSPGNAAGTPPLFTAAQNAQTMTPSAAFYDRHFFNNGKLELVAISLIKTSSLSASAGGFAKMTLQLKFEKIGKTTFGGKHIVRLIPLMVQISNPSPGVQDQIAGSCSSIGKLDLAEKICQNLGGTPDPILNRCDLDSSAFVQNLACQSFGMNLGGTTCL